jgi:hypothetical protein
VGRPRGACEPGSRWNRIAIRADDQNKNLTFQLVNMPDGSNVTAMYIGGVLRSEVDFAVMRPKGLADLGAAWKGPEGGIEYYTNATTGVYYVRLPDEPFTARLPSTPRSSH